MSSILEPVMSTDIMTVQVEQDTVEMHCIVCAESKSWVKKSEYENIQKNNIVFVCDLCTLKHGVIKQVGVLDLELTDVTEVSQRHGRILDGKLITEANKDIISQEIL